MYVIRGVNMYVIRETLVGDFVYSRLYSVPLTWRIHILRLLEGKVELYERPKNGS
jgi:hypothetical protein